MVTTYIIGAFIMMSIVMGILFLRLSHDDENEFILYWGIAWFFCSIALICLLFVIDREFIQLLSIKKIFDMYSLQCLLFGIYRFSRIKIPDFWLRFSIYLTMWLGISVYLNLDNLSTSLPIALFDLIMASFICYIIISKWKENVDWMEKTFYCICFMFWGFLKIYIAIYEAKNSGVPNIFIGEILYTNLLNVCVLIIYLRNIKHEKQKTEERFKIIVENAMDAIFYYTFSQSAAFLYITPSIENITGYSPQVFYKNPKAILNITRKQDFDILNKIFVDDPGKFSTTSEVFQIEKKNNENIWVEMHTSAIREGGEVIAVEGIIRDITEMKAVQDDLQTSKRAKELMLSYISHELKTPITSILGYATALQEGIINDSAEKKKAMEIICRKSIILERMILDLFQLSQLETNQYSFTYKQMEGTELAEYIYQSIITELKESKIKYKIIIEQDLLVDINVIVDPIRINQIITNLVTNAIKYTREKNYITVKFTADKERQNVEISVIDKGQGIAKEDLPHIFERFFKSENPETSALQGRGLGLALSKEIVEAHGGTIKARSKYGKGSIFIVTIPIYFEEEEDNKNGR